MLKSAHCFHDDFQYPVANEGNQLLWQQPLCFYEPMSL